MTGAHDAAPPAAPAPRRLPSLPLVRRGDGDRVVAGVCAGIAAALRVDDSLVRLAFVILAFASGSGIVLYLGLWLLLPGRRDAAQRSVFARAAGVVLLAAAGLLAMRGLGLEDSLLWPGALIAYGVVLVGRRPQSLWRAGVGFALVMAGTAIFVNAGDPFGGDEGIVEPGAVAIALVAIVGPWLWRVVQERDAERLERTRSQERAEVAGRVHDSVLQTLALIQRHAGDARRVATLARREERELRGLLYGRTSEYGDALAAAVERAAAEVEELHGVRVEVVAAGDAPLDERLEALVLAAREAMTNAAKFSGVEAISVYVEARPDAASVFVRDTGAGFDRALVPPDRHGIRESIEGRLVRHGGTAGIVSAPGAGTEVVLTVPRVAR